MFRGRQRQAPAPPTRPVPRSRGIFPDRQVSFAKLINEIISRRPVTEDKTIAKMPLNSTSPNGIDPLPPSEGQEGPTRMLDLVTLLLVPAAAVMLALPFGMY